ncbi:YokU family protein [Bacillus timonensis]|nr:YokU family protein [Bacillus timonensis]
MPVCQWCNSSEAIESENTVYWELPDGSRTITLTNTPCIQCKDCHMTYQTEKVIEEIEEHLLLIDTKKLEDVLTYEEFKATPKWLKYNYFNFGSDQ